MATEKILVKKIEINTATDIFLPFQFEVSGKAKRIIGMLFTATFLKPKDVVGNPLIGRIKMTKDPFFKPDIPEFDVFHNPVIRWNKNLIDIDIPVKRKNTNFKCTYQPIANDIGTEYTLKIYIKYTEIDQKQNQEQN